MRTLKQKVFKKNFLMVLMTTAILLILILTTSSPALAIVSDTPNTTEPGNIGVDYQFGYGGGGGGEVPIPPGTTDITGAATTAGVFIMDVQAYSEDNKCSIFIPTGTTGLTEDLEPLTEISIVPMTTPPEPPADANVIGIPYDFGPSGATFDPPITITFTYDPDDVPSGVDPADLKIAFYDSSTGTWVELENIVVDPVTHTISGETSHFTPFSIIAHTIPASLTIGNLVFSPAEIIAGETSTIKVTVTNSGDLTGTYDVVLKINNQIVETKSVTIKGHSSTEVAFSVLRTIPGSCLIDVNGLSGILKISAAPTTTPTPTPTTPAPTTTPTSTPTTPAPTTTPTPTATTPAPTTTPTSTPTTPAPTTTQTPTATTPAPTPTSTTPMPTTPAPTKPIGINWALIGGLLAAVIVVSGVLWLYLARRRD